MIEKKFNEYNTIEDAWEFLERCIENDIPGVAVWDNLKRIRSCDVKCLDDVYIAITSYNKEEFRRHYLELFSVWDKNV